MKVYIKRLVIYFIVWALVLNFSYFIFAYLNKNLRLNIEKILYPEKKIEEPKIKPPKVFTPKRFRILTPNDLLKSELVPIKPTEKLEEKSIKVPALYISPDKYRQLLAKDEEWKPLPPPKEGIEHKLDWQLPEWETHLRIYGRQIIGFKVGDSHYLRSPKSEEARARSSAVHIGFKPEQSLEIHIQGKIGKKVTIQIDSSGRQEVDTYKVEYKALEEEEFIQQIVAGNIGVSIPGSAYAVGSGGGTKSAFGIKAVAQRGDFKFQAIASMTRGITEVKHFKGTSQLVVRNIRDYDYIKRKYFLLNQGNPINSGTLKVYIDDGNPDNNFASVKFYYTISNQSYSNYCDLQYSGKDYIIDYNTGMLTFLKSIGNNYDVFVTYERKEGPDPYISTNSPYNIMVSNVNDPDKKYIFIFKSSAGVPSPYEYKGIYKLPHRNIQKDDKDFKFIILDRDFNKVEPQPFDEIDRQSYTPSGASYASYYIDEVRGYIIFNRSEPFLFQDSYYIKNPDKSIYGYNPQQSDSYYYIHIEYRYESRTFQLHWNMIPESEMVFVDGRKLIRNVDYTIDYQTGYLEFKSDRVVITPETEIDIVYEYYPFGGALQQILAGLRVDYQPYDWLSLGTVGFYNGKQTPARVPSPRNATDNRWVGSLFGKISFDKEIITDTVNNLFHRRFKELPFSLNLSAEYAGSYYNVNSFGQAMLDDFEGTLERLSLSVNYNDWYLAPARPGTGEENTRGILYFVDYYDHDDDYDGNWKKFSEGGVSVTYTTKPGPYTVDDGHLELEQLQDIEADQVSLVFDYDFSSVTNSGSAWVGAIKSSAFRGGKDFRNYTDLVLWVKLIDTDVQGGSVRLEIDIGEFSEDLDGDGRLDEEKSKDDSGFIFNFPDGTTTYIGGGPAWSPEYKANNRLDTEDLDRDGQPDFILNEKLITIPDGNYAKPETGGDSLIIKEGGWRLIRIKLNEAALDDEKKEWLKTVKHIRIRLIKDNGNRGKLLIDEMYFSGLRWRDIKINEETVNTNNEDYFRVYTTSTFDDVYYKENSLREYAEEEFDDLHGSLTEVEAAQLNEHALVIEYSNFKRYNFNTTVASNTNNKYCMAYVTRDYSYTIDMRYYKKIKFWVYVPALPQNRRGEYIFLRFGTANNYYEYRKKLDWTGWKKLEIDMRSSEFESLKPVEGIEGKYTGKHPHFRVVGIPNLQNVNQISIGIYGSDTQDGATGWVWVNDMYLDDVDKKKDKAYSVSGTFNIDKHLSISATHSYRGKHFSQIGGMGTGVESKNYSLSANWTSIGWLPITGTYSKSITKSDVNQIFVPINKQGLTVSRSYSGTAKLSMPSMPGIKDFYPQYWPNFNFSASYSESTNWKPLSWLPETSEYKLSYFSSSHNFGFSGASSKIPFLDTFLNINANLNGSYSYSFSTSGNVSYTKNSTNVYMYSTKTNFNQNKSISQNLGGSLRRGSFTITPKIGYRYTLIRTSTNIKKLKFRKIPWDLSSRSRSFSTGLSVGKVLFITPSINYSFSYNESGFYYKNNIRDEKYYIFDDISVVDEDPNLRKNATTSQSISLSVGSFNINKFIFKTLTPSYSKSMGLTQTDISAKTNTMMKTFGKVGKDFLLKLPGYYFYIPIINEHYYTFRFVRKFKDEGYSSSLSMRNSFSARLGLYLAEWSQWSLYYSVSQNTSRNAGSYSFSSSWSINANSSLNLMNLLNFWIWRQTGKYRKSSALSYGITYRETNNYLQKSKQWSVSLPFSFSYRWSANSSIGWSLRYTRNKTRFEKYEKFYEIVEKDAEEEGEENFREKIEPPDQDYPPRIDEIWNFSTSYSFKSKLPEYWKPPLFFKKPIKLGFDLNHTTTFSFMRHTYDYGNDGAQDFIHPKETLYQISINHSITFAISKNIDGGGHLKLVVEETREELGLLGNDNDYKELILSWELGFKLTIRF